MQSCTLLGGYIYYTLAIMQQKAGGHYKDNAEVSGTCTYLRICRSLDLRCSPTWTN